MSHLAAVVACQPFRGGAIDVDDRGKARPGVANDILGVDRTDAAGAELAEADHVRQFGYGLKSTL